MSDPFVDNLNTRMSNLGRILVPKFGSGDNFFPEYASVAIVNRQVADTNTTPPPFYPTIVPSGGGFLVTVAPGAIGYWNSIYAEGEDPLKFETPELGGQPLTAYPPPQLPVGLNQWVVCRVQTNKQNQIIATPEILVSSDTGQSYLPEFTGLGEDVDPTENEGRDGDYYIKLFRIILVNGSPVPDHRVWSDPILSPYIWGADVKGDGKGNVFIKFNPASGKYEFRKVKREHGIEILQDENVSVKFDAQNIGEGVGVYSDAGGVDSKAEFRSLTDDGGELTITEEGDVIRIRGNKKNGYLRFVKCDGGTAYTLSWQDGLIQNGDQCEVRLGDCCNELPPGA